MQLNRHLYKMQKTTSPLCPTCGRSDKTVHHFLTQCPMYRVPRERMEHTLKRGATEIRILLGRLNAMPALFQYINDTGRFKATFGDVQLPGG